MSKRDIDHCIDLEITEDDIKDVKIKNNATYRDIKDYVLKKYDLNVSTLYIAQVKNSLGLTERESF
ncbi:23S rRNA (uracil-5-)-methyltransferase RumA, partial [Streptococcus pluranimalium]